jgi:hypothetical protein
VVRSCLPRLPSEPDVHAGLRWICQNSFGGPNEDWRLIAGNQVIGRYADRGISGERLGLGAREADADPAVGAPSDGRVVHLFQPLFGIEAGRPWVYTEELVALLALPRYGQNGADVDALRADILAVIETVVPMARDKQPNRRSAADPELDAQRL